MGAFEHILLLLSFVYALAIAHLLATWARLIAHAGRVSFSWTHGLWMVNALMVNLANWIGFWDLRALTEWTVASIFFTFAMAFINYLQTALVCPELAAKGVIDLPAFEAAQGRRHIGAFIASLAFALVANIAYGQGFSIAAWAGQNEAVIPMTAIAIAAFAWRAVWVQRLAPILMMGLWAWYFIQLQPSLH